MSNIYKWIKSESKHTPRMMVKALGVSSSGYYQWLNSKPSQRSIVNDLLLNKIEKAFKSSGYNYGSPRITKCLCRSGENVNRKSVARLMKLNGLKVKTKRKYVNTTNSSHSLPIADNLLDRKFDVSEPNTVWAGDITYIPTKSGWLYLSVVMDLYSRKVVGWSMNKTMETNLVSQSLKMAYLNRNPDSDLIFHSDRGSQYASTRFNHQLTTYQITPSMSRKGNCWDNACVESFFSIMKREGCGKVFDNRQQAELEIFKFIEVYYNRQRLHSTLDYYSPEQFESMKSTLST